VNNPYLSNERLVIEPSVRYIVRGYQGFIMHERVLYATNETKLHYIEPFMKVKYKTADGVGINPFIGAGISLLTRAEGVDFYYLSTNTSIDYEKYDVFLMAGFDLTFMDRFIIGFDYSGGFRNILYDYGIDVGILNNKPRLFNNTINVSVGILF
jgi:hypothetical protein